jgi:hypothetical protein
MCKGDFFVLGLALMAASQMSTLNALFHIQHISTLNVLSHRQQGIVGLVFGIYVQNQSSETIKDILCMQVKGKKS